MSVPTLGGFVSLIREYKVVPDLRKEFTRSRTVCSTVIAIMIGDTLFMEEATCFACFREAP